jgi:hypothetical protein
MLKVMLFGGLALVAYINLGFIGFYEDLNWSSTLAKASGSVRWPNFKFVFEFGFNLPRLFMFNFDWEVKMFFIFGVGLILIDEVIKRFRSFFYAFSFSAYQRIYDPESMTPAEQESDLCMRLQEVQGGELCENIIKTAKLAGGLAGREVMLALLRGKLKPHLDRLKLTWDDVEPLVASLHTINDLEGALRTAAAMIGRAAKPLVRRKLEELDVQPEA